MERTEVDYSNLDLDTMYNNYKNHNPHKLANDEMFKTEEGSYMYFTKEQFIDNIKTNDRFLSKWL